jgi:hypothetical protein
MVADSIFGTLVELLNAAQIFEFLVHLKLYLGKGG